MKQEKNKPFTMKIQEENCKGDECAICSSAFRCPALYQDSLNGKAQMREDICTGCGVCTDICPFNAIIREEVA
jgi:indolepyruvate ferredoxin oxidoreductase alpha subunit